MASQRFFRIVGKRRSGEDALRSSAGRFHGHESPATSYAALRLETAWREVMAGLGNVRPNPSAFHAFEIELVDPDLEDLTEGGELEGVMKDPAPPEGKALAERLRRAGKDGLVYPSMRDPEGECVVLFLENLEERIEMKPVSTEVWRALVESVL